MSEQAIQSQIRLLSNLWRNNSGAMVDSTGRAVRFGLGNDSKKINQVFKSSDLIGITPVIIQQEHVGQTLGIFTGVEVKDGRGNRHVAQQNFIDYVNDRGGIAGFAGSVIEYQMLMMRRLAELKGQDHGF